MTSVKQSSPFQKLLESPTIGGQNIQNTNKGSNADASAAVDHTPRQAENNANKPTPFNKIVPRKAKESGAAASTPSSRQGGEDFIDKLANNLQKHYTKVLNEFGQATSIPLLNPDDLLAKSAHALQAAKDIVNEAALKPGNRLWDIAISNNKASCILRMSREWASGNQSRITTLAAGFKEIRFLQSLGVEHRVRGIKLL